MRAGEVDERRIVVVRAAPVLLPVSFLEKQIGRHVRFRQIVVHTGLPIPPEHFQAQRRPLVAVEERLQDAQGGFDVRAVAVLLADVDHVRGRKVGEQIFEIDRLASLPFQNLPFLK